MNVAQAINEAQQILNKAQAPMPRAGMPANSTWIQGPVSQSRWINIFNQCIYELNSRVDQDVARQQKFTIVTPANTEDGFVIPKNWLRILGVVTTGWSLIRSDLDILEYRTTLTKSIWQREGKLFFGVASETVSLWVQVEQPEVTGDEDELPFHQKWHLLMVNMAVLKLLHANNLENRPALENDVQIDISRFCTENQTHAAIDISDERWLRRIAK